MNDLMLTRRHFGLSLGGWAMANRLLAAGRSLPWAGAATVHKVFLAVPQPSWPRPDLDVMKEKAELDAVLSGLEKKHPALLKFVGGELVRTVEDAEAFVKKLGDIDGVVIVDLTSGTGGLLRPMREIPAPVLLYARPYSGWSYVDVANWAQSGKKADLLSSSDPGDLDPYARMFQTVHHLRKSKVLVVSQRPSAVCEAFTKQYGTAFGFPAYSDLKAIYEKESPKRAQEAADKFIKGALKIVEPSRQEVVDSMRLYHAVMTLLEREKANAITVDCLGGFRRGDLPAYPCVAWAKLNDAGLYGVCEADVPTTMTQLLLTSFSGKPGFVSDPVFDTSRSEIIHAHCVSATCLQGVGGAPSPYIIRTHMEDAKGVSLQVLVPIQDTITCAKFVNPTTFAVSTGTVTGNVDDPRGCRTKFRTRVADARKMLDNFGGGLHRVVVYGDYMQPVQRMGRLMGFKVVQEC